MVYNFKVFKKCSPNGKVTIYMGKRDFVDHVSGVEPIGANRSFSVVFLVSFNMDVSISYISIYFVDYPYP